MRKFITHAVIGAALLFSDQAMALEPMEAKVRDFIAIVKSGQDLTSSDYGTLLTPQNLAALKHFGKCQVSEPSRVKGDTYWVVWQCNDGSPIPTIITSITFSDVNTIASIDNFNPAAQPPSVN